MTVIACNPLRIDAASLLGPLRRTFDGEWDEGLVEWYLARRFDGRDPDLMLVLRGDEAIAGNGINYRQLRRPDGELVDVGIVTASWTLPEERRQGHFSRLMAASADRAKERGCSLLLGFVTEGNGSELGLRNYGANAVPTIYLKADPNHPGGVHDHADLVIEPMDPADVPAPGEIHPRNDRVSFHYRRREDWNAQFLQRPYPVETLRIGSCFAIIESTPESDRLQFLAGNGCDPSGAIGALAARSARRNRQFFTFSTASWAFRAAETGAFEARRGFIMCLPTDRIHEDHGSLFEVSWEIQSGDRM